MTSTETDSGRTTAGRAVSVIGILLSIVSAYYVSIALGALGMILGMAGYALGSRNLGRATVIIGLLAIFAGLLFGQDVMAGAYDRAVDGVFRSGPARE